MAYLLPAGMDPRTKNKWGLGALGVVRTRMPRSRGMSYFTKKGSLGRLGQESTDIDYATGLPCDDPRANCQTQIEQTTISAPTALISPAVATPPQQPGVNPSIQAAYANLLTQQQNSKNPLDYVSPQAAIAAGLPAQQVYNAWSQALARFPSQQAALNAGVPAGVVTQLWAQSRSAMPTGSTGISTNTLLIGAGILFGLPLLLGGRGRR